jgi:N-acetylglucosaminyldiphosphoundecaprenol N-acetyl-beta-D-mannosaminyltransferase
VSKARFRKQTKSKKAKRAPKWMHGAGLEWLFRLIQEPKRMYRRYLIEAPLFIPLVILDRIKKFK